MKAQDTIPMPVQHVEVGDMVLRGEQWLPVIQKPRFNGNYTVTLTLGTKEDPSELTLQMGASVHIAAQ